MISRKGNSSSKVEYRTYLSFPVTKQQLFSAVWSKV